MNDARLADLLAAEPRVRVDERTGKMTVEAREERVPDEPDACPACGESYEKRALHRTNKHEADRPGEGYAIFHHGERSGFFAAGCRVDDYWTLRSSVVVSVERAKRVSGGRPEADA